MNLYYVYKKRKAWSGTKLFVTLMVFLKDVFENPNFGTQKSADDQKNLQNKLPDGKAGFQNWNFQLKI